jgi:microcystin-dependent protein
MSDPFVAEIRMFAGNFAPTGWALCAGQLMPISQNTALFSLLGTYYGGDGKSTFGLPDLEGSAPMGAGQGQGLSDRFLGEQSGEEAVTLLQTEMPVHTHIWMAGEDPANQGIPDPARVVAPGVATYWQTPATGPFVQANPNMLSVAGSSFPHNNLMPYLGITYIIALQGVFPPRT